MAFVLEQNLACWQATVLLLAPTRAMTTRKKAKEISSAKFLKIGLELDGFMRWRTYKYNANLSRFTKHYGMLPSTVAKVWQLLRDSNEDDVRLEANAKPAHLLLALSYLWHYETEQGYSRDFKITEKTGRKWHKEYVRKVAGLLPSLVRAWSMTTAASYC